MKCPTLKYQCSNDIKTAYTAIHGYIRFLLHNNHNICLCFRFVNTRSNNMLLQSVDKRGLTRENSVELQVPADDFRERRFIFLETNRMPKEIRERLTKDQLRRLPMHRLGSGVRENYANGGQLLRTAYLGQLYHRKTKLWSGSIAKRYQKQDTPRRATAIDIVRHIDVPTDSTSEDHYIVADGSALAAPVDSVKQLHQSESPSGSVMSTLGDSSCKLDEGDFVSNCKQLEICKLSPAARTVSKERHLKYKTSISSKFFENSTLARLRVELKQHKSLPLKDNIHRSVKTADSRGYRREYSSASDSTTEADRSPTQSRLPSVSLHSGGTLMGRTTSAASTDGFLDCDTEQRSSMDNVRKPVIPSLTHLTEVIGYSSKTNSHDSERPRYMSQEYTLQVIHKHHGNQIVVDSTEYDNFARKRTKKQWQ